MHLVLNRCRKQMIHYWRRYPSSNWYEIDQKTHSKFGALLWRHLMPERKKGNIGAQQHSMLYTTAKNDFGKFTSCRTFGAHNLVHSELFLDHRYEIWHSLSALCSDVRKKKLYRCKSTVSALNYCGRIFFLNPSAIYTKWCAQLFRRIFGFLQLLTAISRKLWRHLATEMRTM